MNLQAALTQIAYELAQAASDRDEARYKLGQAVETVKARDDQIRELEARLAAEPKPKRATRLKAETNGATPEPVKIDKE